MSAANGSPGAAARSARADVGRGAGDLATLARDLEAVVGDAHALAAAALRHRPYLTLGGAVGIGYVLGARAPAVLHRLTTAAGRQLLVSALARHLIAGVAAPDGG
jgi:hypothetical protein